MPNQRTLLAQCAQILDVEAAEIEWRRTGRLCLEAFAEPLVNMLAQWCAPVRDPDVAKLRDISDPIDFFRSVDLVRLTYRLRRTLILICSHLAIILSKQFR